MGREASQRSRHSQAGSVAGDEGHCRRAKNNVDPEALLFRDWSCVQGGSQIAQDEERWVVRKGGAPELILFPMKEEVERCCCWRDGQAWRPGRGCILVPRGSV